MTGGKLASANSPSRVANLCGECNVYREFNYLLSSPRGPDFSYT
jgi:hypothetical protein